MISSIANEKVKYVRSLHSRSTRHRERRFIVEGTRLVEEMNETGQKPVFVFYTELLAAKPVGRELVDELAASGGEVLAVSDEVMRAMADTKTPQGILAVLPFPEIEGGESGLIVVLDGVRDPGNLGTILRSADAAGAGQVITIKGAVDGGYGASQMGAMLEVGAGDRLIDRAVITLGYWTGKLKTKPPTLR